MPQIRLVASDMDGTFLTSSREPHPKNIEAVRMLVDSGVTFCLASGRGISTMRSLLNQLELTGPAVSSNGAHVICPKGTVIFDSVLEPETISTIISYAQENNIHVNRYYQECITFSKCGELADLYQSRTGCKPDFLKLEDIKQLPATKLLFIGQHEAITKHFEYFQSHTGLNGTSIVRSEPDYLEFLPAGINKGIGLQKLASHLGIKSEECAAIGDWLNDSEMLQWVGFPASVSNAIPEIKVISNEIYSSNDNGGVSEFIQAIIEQNREGIITD